MSDFLVKNNGAWTWPKYMWIKDAGAWKQIKKMWVRDGGAWKVFYDYMLGDVSLTVNDTYITDAEQGEAATPSIFFGADGLVYKTDDYGVHAPNGAWLAWTPDRAYAAPFYEIRATQQSGSVESFVSDPLDTWLPLSQERRWGLVLNAPQSGTLGGGGSGFY